MINNITRIAVIAAVVGVVYMLIVAGAAMRHDRQLGLQTCLDKGGAWLGSQVGICVARLSAQRRGAMQLHFERRTSKYDCRNERIYCAQRRRLRRTAKRIEAMSDTVTLGDAVGHVVQRMIERKIRHEFREAYGRQLAACMLSLTLARDAMKRSGTAFDHGFAEVIREVERTLTLLSIDPQHVKTYDLSTHLADTICNQLTLDEDANIVGVDEAVDEVLRLFHVIPRKEPLP